MTLVAQTLQYTFDGDVRAAYYAVPAGNGLFPGVVVIHELWGLNNDIKTIARRFAAEGYAALAVDLFANRNKAVCMFRLLRGALTNAFDHVGIRELRAALDQLGERPEVDAQRVGAVGYCLGGGLAIAWACADDRLQAIAPYYGTNPRPLAAVARACPVVGSYPARDHTAQHARSLVDMLARHNVPHDIKFYDNVAHSFANQGRNFAPTAAEDAWQRTLAFFEQHVRQAGEATRL